MRNKIILINYKELENFEYKKYGGDIFALNFDVEVWSLSKIFLGNNVKTKDIYAEQKQVDSIREFVMCLRKYSRKHTFLFFLFPSAKRKTFYFEAIVSIMGFQYSMAYCQPYLAQWNSGSLGEALKRRGIDYIGAILNGIFPPTFNFVAALSSYKEFPSVWSIKRQNNVLIHTLDYDNYLKIRNEKKRLIESKYIIFVDESYVAHYDYQIFNINSPFRRPEDYYTPLNRFFDYLENTFGCPVVIAEHPRAHYVDRNIYGNRKMIRGQTARLIRDAEMVICHTSTAIDYIILFKKDFLIIYLDEIKNFYEWEKYYIPLFNYLKIKGLNISNFYDRAKIKSIVASGSANYCERYKHQFIKSKGTREEMFFKVASEYIMQEMRSKES